MFKRPIAHVLEKRIREPRRFIQTLIGPRQTGKTTLVQQVMADLAIPTLYASADEPVLKHTTWVEQQWEAARFKTKTDAGYKKALLVLDEIQKIPAWSDAVKRLWDEDSPRVGLSTWLS